MISKKQIRQSKNIQQLLTDAWLGIYVDEDKIVNPLAKIPDSFEDAPHLYLTYLLMQPEYFAFLCKYILNIELLPFQAAVLKELWNKTFPMLIMTRGGSKTWSLAVYAILRSLLLPGRKIVIAGSVFRQAKFVFDYVERIWSNAPILRDIAKNYGRAGSKKDTDMWQFRIGESNIIAIPLGATGESIRGLRAEDLILDEFKSINREIFETVLSGFLAVSSDPFSSVQNEATKTLAKQLGIVLQRDESNIVVPNQLVISGTPHFRFNHFYDYWKMWHDLIEKRGELEERGSVLDEAFSLDHRKFSVIRIPVELIPKGFMEDSQIARSRATMHSGTYSCEYRAVFSMDSTGFFKRSLLESCTVGDNIIEFPSCGEVMFNPMIRGNPHRKYVFGIDPASESDNFGLVILEVHPDHRRVVYCWTIQRRQQKQAIKDGLIEESDYFTYLAMKIRELMRFFPCERIGLDPQGGGVSVLEALSRVDNLKSGEVPLLEIIDPENPKDTDSKEGLHIIELANFSDYKWVSHANHTLRMDFENKMCLFPAFNSLTLGLAEAVDSLSGKSYDTLEDCVGEIEELKNELTSIIMTQTSTGKDKWDTPDTLEAGKKKGKMRKDRYTALLIANAVARELNNVESRTFGTIGGFSYDIDNKKETAVGPEFIGPTWYVNKMRGVY